MEKVYIGTKIVAAEPMDEETFASQFHAGIGTGPATPVNRQGYKVRYRDGYTSWCPKEEFELANREITAQEKALFGIK